VRRRQLAKLQVVSQDSLSTLNWGQTCTMQLGMLGGLLVAANASAQGTMSIGDFVMVAQYITQLFKPLSNLYPRSGSNSGPAAWCSHGWSRVRALAWAAAPTTACSRRHRPAAAPPSHRLFVILPLHHAPRPLHLPPLGLPNWTFAHSPPPCRPTNQIQ
jgi:hypothetical protein